MLRSNKQQFKDTSTGFLRKFTIFSSAFGFGTYHTEAEEKFKTSIKNSDESIQASEKSLKAGNNILAQSNELLNAIRLKGPR